jgi:hypothetical protein
MNVATAGKGRSEVKISSARKSSRKKICEILRNSGNLDRATISSTRIRQDRAGVCTRHKTQRKRIDHVQFTVAQSGSHSERGSTMFNSAHAPGGVDAVLVLVAGILSGCESRQDKALDQAKKQAAATGQAQQVVSVDKNGTTTTTVVQPPAAGTDERGDHDDGNTARGWDARSSTLGTDGFAVPPPPVPVNVTIPAGTMLTIRIDQRISVKTSRAGDTFTGEIVEPVLAGDNSVLVPKGALVGGVVDVSHRRGHFKGRSLLELRLTSLT